MTWGGPSLNEFFNELSREIPHGGWCIRKVGIDSIEIGARTERLAHLLCIIQGNDTLPRQMESP